MSDLDLSQPFEALCPCGQSVTFTVEQTSVLCSRCSADVEVEALIAQVLEKGGEEAEKLNAVLNKLMSG